MADQLDRLYQSFAKLRKTQSFQRAVLGGVATIEVTYNPGTDEWHPHLHVLFEGRYLPHRDVKAEWFRITGDSTIVHLKVLPSKEAAARYVAKYVAKPLANSFVNRPHRLDEIIVAFKGRRLCLTFGEWRGVVLTQTPDPGTWNLLGSLDDLCSRANDGERLAIQAVAALAGDRVHDLLCFAAKSRPPPHVPAPKDVQLLLPPIPFFMDD